MGGRVENLVECRSGSEYAEHPAALHWEGQRLEIVEISARWRTPAGKFFQVRVQDNRRFELFYSEALDEWQIRLI